MTFEPGPLAPLDPSQFPKRGVIDPDIERAVVPQSAALLAAEQLQATNLSLLHAAGEPDIDGDHASELRPAYDEVARQYATAHELTTDEALLEVAASLTELDGIAADLPAEDSDYEEPQIPGEGDDDIPTSRKPDDLGIDIDDDDRGGKRDD